MQADERQQPSRSEVTPNTNKPSKKAAAEVKVKEVFDKAGQAHSRAREVAGREKLPPMQQWLASLDQPRPNDQQRWNEISHMGGRTGPISAEESEELRVIEARRDNEFLVNQLPPVTAQILEELPRHVALRVEFDLEAFDKSRKDPQRAPVYASTLLEVDRFTREMRQSLQQGLEQGDLVVVAAAIDAKASELDTIQDSMRHGMNDTLPSPNNLYNPINEKDREMISERYKKIVAEAERVGRLDSILRDRTGLRTDFDWNEVLGMEQTEAA